MEYSGSLQKNKNDELSATCMELNKEIEKTHKQKLSLIDEKDAAQRDLNNKIHELQKKANEGRHVFQSVYSTSKLFSHKFNNFVKNDEEFFSKRFCENMLYYDSNPINPQEIEISDSLKYFDNYISNIYSEFEVNSGI